MTPKNVLLLITPSSPGRFKGISIFARSHGWHLTVADRLTHMLDGWTGDGALVTLRDDEDTLRRVVDLRRRRIPVAEIARRTGYCNPAYLVNVFRDATGLSPKKWRNSGMF